MPPGVVGFRGAGTVPAGHAPRTDRRCRRDTEGRTMKSKRSTLRVLAAAAALAVGLTACGGDSGTGAGGTGNDPAAGGGAKGTIKVGAFGFPESTLLATIYAKQLTKDGFSASVVQL